MRHVLNIGGEQVECNTERTTRYGGPWMASAQMAWAIGKSEREALTLLRQFLEAQPELEMYTVTAGAA